MAYTSIAAPIPPYVLSSATEQTQTLDNANDGAAIIFTAIAGDITKIHVPFNAVTGTPTMQGSIQGVSSAAPDGSILASGNAYADVAVTGSAVNTFTLGASVTTAAGDKIAAVVRYLSGSTSGVAAYGSTGTVIRGSALPRAMRQDGGAAWAGNDGYVPRIAVEYSDGTIIGSGFRLSNMTTWNSGSTPFRGTKWTPNINCKINGIYVGFQPSSTSDFTVHMYTGTSGTATLSVTVDVSEMYAGVANQTLAYIPIPLTTLTAGTVYRFVVEMTTANNPTSATLLAFGSAALYAASVGGSEWAYTTATTAGSWSDTANSFFPIYPNIVSVEGAGGVKINQGMTGGLL